MDETHCLAGSPTSPIPSVPPFSKSNWRWGSTWNVALNVHGRCKLQVQPFKSLLLFIHKVQPAAVPVPDPAGNSHLSAAINGNKRLQLWLVPPWKLPADFHQGFQVKKGHGYDHPCHSVWALSTRRHHTRLAQLEISQVTLRVLQHQDLWPGTVSIKPRHKSLAVHPGICQQQPQLPWGQHRAACKGLAPDTELTKHPHDLPWQKQDMQLQFRL